MLSARIGDAFECLRRTAAISATATVVINSPPRCPGSERVVVAIWRRVICRRRGYRPIGFGISEPAAGVVFCLDTEHRLAADKMRSLCLDLARHLEFGTAKFLYLELMVITAAGN